MMRINRLHSLLGAALGLCVLAPGLAMAMPSSPPPLVEAFAETCRRGFPDLATVRQSALTAGWVERAVRPIGGSEEFQAAVPPVVLQKGPWTLFLTAPPSTGRLQSCQVVGTVEGDLAIGPLASAASLALGVGPAQFIRSSGADLARWRSDPSMLVQASVSRAPRSASLQVRVQP